MTLNCDCSITFGNTGAANCEPIQDVTVRAILVNLLSDDGVRNSVPVSTVIDDTFVSGKLSESDKSKRWYPTRELANVTDQRADPNTEDIDGIGRITSKGARVFKGYSVETESVYLSKISSGECVAKIGVYIIDQSNRLIGDISADGTELYPFAIEPGTFWTGLDKTEQGVIQKTQVNWTYSRLLRDENIAMMQAEADLVNIEGLLDVLATVANEAVDGFTADLTLVYGYINNLIKVEGWEVADFELYNETQGTAVAITSVTESPEGFYTFVIPTVLSGDVLTLTESSAKSANFELETTITIP